MALPPDPDGHVCENRLRGASETGATESVAVVKHEPAAISLNVEAMPIA
ncbi:MAG: hypothetical protein IH855_01040 [Bacteroidetes bacterium]|nr:hypothetical protein [Bacteroidota bacterium]